MNEPGGYLRRFLISIAVTIVGGLIGVLFLMWFTRLDEEWTVSLAIRFLLLGPPLSALFMLPALGIASRINSPGPLRKFLMAGHPIAMTLTWVGAATEGGYIPFAWFLLGPLMWLIVVALIGVVYATVIWNRQRNQPTSPPPTLAPTAANS